MLGVCSLSVRGFLHEVLHMHVILSGSKAMIWREKEKSRIRAVQKGNLRGHKSIRWNDSLTDCLKREVSVLAEQGFLWVVN